MVTDRKPKILVVGDIMLDHYIYGHAGRISPEAPIPVLSWEKEEWRLGGAGAVAAMCAALGADVSIAAVTGADDDYRSTHVIPMLDAAGVDWHGLQKETGRATTIKTRIVGIASGRHCQQMIRMDRETPFSFSGQLKGISGTFDVVIVSDYAKGFCSPQIISGLQRFGPVIVDPPKMDGWRKKYVGAAGCFVPNRSESGGPKSIEQARGIAAEMRETMSAEVVIVKLDADGCVLATRDQCSPLPTVARQVIDVCGAGDQFVATLAVGRARGLPWPESCRIANVSAGLQCDRFGCDPIGKDEIEWPELRDSQREPSSRMAALTSCTPGISRCSAKPALKAIR